MVVVVVHGNMIYFLMGKFPWIWKVDGLLGSEYLVVLSCSFTLKLMERHFGQKSIFYYAWSKYIMKSWDFTMTGRDIS